MEKQNRLGSNTYSCRERSNSTPNTEYYCPKDLFRLTLCHHALEASLEKTSLDDYASDRAHGHSIWIVRRPGLK